MATKYKIITQVNHFRALICLIFKPHIREHILLHTEDWIGCSIKPAANRRPQLWPTKSIYFEDNASSQLTWWIHLTFCVNLEWWLRLFYLLNVSVVTVVNISLRCAFSFNWHLNSWAINYLLFKISPKMTLKLFEPSHDIYTFVHIPCVSLTVPLITRYKQVPK